MPPAGYDSLARHNRKRESGARINAQLRGWVLKMASNVEAWSIMRSALYGVIAGIVVGVVVTAARGNLDNSSILISAMLSGAGLGIVLGAALAWLRNFVRGV